MRWLAAWIAWALVEIGGLCDSDIYWRLIGHPAYRLGTRLYLFAYRL